MTRKLCIAQEPEADALLAANHANGRQIGPDTNRNGSWGEFSLPLVLAAISNAVG